MTKCYPNTIHFSSVQRRKVEAEFSGGAITGNRGIPLLAEVDRQLGLTHSVSKYLGDARRQASCEPVISSEQMSGYWQCVQEMDEHFFDLTQFFNSSLMTYPNLYSPKSGKGSRKTWDENS